MLFRMVEQGIEDKGSVPLNMKKTESVSDRSHEDALWAIVMARDLWKRGVWCVACIRFQANLLLTILRNDAKTVSIVSLGCFHSSVKVQSAAMHFFLGSEDEEEENSDDEEEVIVTSPMWSFESELFEGPRRKSIGT